MVKDRVKITGDQLGRHTVLGEELQPLDFRVLNA